MSACTSVTGVVIVRVYIESDIFQNIFVCLKKFREVTAAI